MPRTATKAVSSNMPHRQSQPQGHREADQVSGSPDAKNVVDVLVPVLGVVSNAIADPSTDIPGVAENAGFENVEGGQVDTGPGNWNGLEKQRNGNSDFDSWN